MSTGPGPRRPPTAMRRLLTRQLRNAYNRGWADCLRATARDRYGDEPHGDVSPIDRLDAWLDDLGIDLPDD